MPLTVTVRGVSGAATAGVTLTIARSTGSESLAVCARAEDGPSSATASRMGRQEERKYLYIRTPISGYDPSAGKIPAPSITRLGMEIKP